MKKAVMKYKKAARALRTFNSTIRDGLPDGDSPETKEERIKYFKAQTTLRDMLDKTLGSHALAALYWEGKEL